MGAQCAQTAKRIITAMHQLHKFMHKEIIAFYN
jgi:hypothetical protein